MAATLNIYTRIEALREIVRTVQAGVMHDGQKINLSQEDLISLMKKGSADLKIELPDLFLSDGTKISKFINRRNSYSAHLRENNIDDAEFLFEYINDFYEEKIKSVIGEEGAHKYLQNTNDISDYFIDKLREGFSKKFDSQVDKKIEDYISRRKKIPKESVDEYVTAFPSYFISIIDSNSPKGEISDLIEASNHNTYNTKNVSSKRRHEVEIDQFEGIVLGHSLSPLPDNLAFIMELGKFKRLESVYRKQGTIIVTDPEYASYNQVVDILKENNIPNDEILKGIKKNFKYRKKIYEFLGFKNENLEVLKVRSDSEFKKLDKAQFLKHSGYFNFLVKKIKEVSSKLPSAKQKLKYMIDELLSEDELDEDIIKAFDEKNEFLRFNDRYIFEVEILSIILKNFNSLSENTISYTLLQRFAQHKYSNYLKFGNSGEINFDKVYSLLDENEINKTNSDGLKEYRLHAYYYKHYKFMKDESTVVSCIPYYTCNQAMYEKFNHNYDDIIDTIPFVTDNYSANGNGARKIEFQGENLSTYELARQISDLLSFAIYAFRDSEESLWEQIVNVTENLSSDFANAIEKERKSDQDSIVQAFGNKVLSIMNKYIEIPYFYYPFILYLKSREDNLIEKKIRDYYKEIIKIILNELQVQISSAEWTLSPKASD